MALNIGEIRNKVISRIQDKVQALSVSPGGDVDVCILSAVEEYQKDHPLEKAVRVAGAGTYKYAISNLTGYVDGFSSIKGVAYPHLGTEQDLPWLDGQDFGTVRDHNGLSLWFAGMSPTAAEFFLTLFTLPHTVSATAWTPRSSDDEAIADLAAGYCCDELAARYSQETDTTIQADSVNRLQKADLYRSMATRFKDSYKRKMQSVGKAATAIAVGFTNTGFGDAFHSDYLFHGRRRF